MKLEIFKCVNCASTEFTRDGKFYKCEYCGSLYSDDKTEIKITDYRPTEMDMLRLNQAANAYKQRMEFNNALQNNSVLGGLLGGGVLLAGLFGK